MLSRPEAGGADWNEGTVGGIPSKEDPNAPRPRSGVPVGGAARESKNAPEKGTFRLGGMPAITRTRRLKNAPADLSGRDAGGSACGRIGPMVRQRVAWTGRRLPRPTGGRPCSSMCAHALVTRERKSGSERLRAGGWRNRPPCGRSRGLDTAIGVVRLHHSRRVRPVEERAAQVRNGTRENRSHEQSTTS